MPVYIVLDTSASMTPIISDIEKALSDLRIDLLEDPLLGEIVRICIITFSNRAQVHFALGDLTSIESLPRIKTGGGTNYAPAFTVLQKTIDRDIILLKSNDISAYRPIVLFLTDGAPMDEESKWAPKVQTLTKVIGVRLLAFGLPGADMTMLRSLGASYATSISHMQKFRYIIHEVAASYTHSALMPMQDIADSGEMFGNYPWDFD